MQPVTWGLCAALLLSVLGVGPNGTPDRELGDVMHAVRIHEFGGRDVLKYEEAPRPVPGKGEVLIKVHAAGVNPVDWKIRKGLFGPVQFPATLGFDVSGVVEAVGEDVKRLVLGDEVYALLPLQKAGGYAEYVVCQESIVALRPKRVDHETAAAVPLAALTAWQALLDHGKLEKGQTVLIHAGAGGVGHFAVQIAKAHGARVIATASPENHEYLTTIGADQVIDYKSQKFEELVKDVDLVLDSIGGQTQSRSIGIIRKGGRLVSIVQPPSREKLDEAGITGNIFLVQPDADQLRRLAELIDAGKIKPYISDTFPLADAAKAHEKSETGRTVGKIVLTVPR